jgi:co-chaperonin GroES (HSP10)|tara:strand:+ start:26572 stop:26829 length:258 start_codon:yes stop_codon:yes gene_type:complete
MRPISKYILVEPIEEELKTESGILLTNEEAQRRRYHKGKVYSVGNEVEGINPDEEIYYDFRNAHTLLIEGKKITVIQQRDVVVVL